MIKRHTDQPPQSQSLDKTCRIPGFLSKSLDGTKQVKKSFSRQKTFDSAAVRTAQIDPVLGCSAVISRRPPVTLSVQVLHCQVFKVLCTVRSANEHRTYLWKKFKKPGHSGRNHGVFRKILYHTKLWFFREFAWNPLDPGRSFDFPGFSREKREGWPVWNGRRRSFPQPCRAHNIYMVPVMESCW